MIRVALIFLLLLQFSVHAQSQVSIAKSFEFESKILKEQRTVVVSLPDGYDASKAAYPVIYLLDGVQNLKHVVGSVDVLTRVGSMPPSIIVGIKSENRMKDFSPTKMVGVEESGGAKTFLNFLSKELIPYINNTYRTNDFSVLEGHSLAGLFAAYTLMESPDLFDAYIVMGPAFWWNKEEPVKDFQAFLSASDALDKALYFGVGKEDGNRHSLKRFVKELETTTPKGVRWKHEEFDDEGHMSAPLLNNYFALKFIFSDMRLPQAIMDDFSSEKFLAHEADIMKKYGQAAKQPQEIYVPLALELMKQENYAGAVTVFRRNAEAYIMNKYPQNYVWLAEALEKNKQVKEAIKVYEQAYTLSKETGYGEADKFAEKVKELKAKL
ncbi:alpha/beta hydrolase-fold protein [Pseudoalteromonas umbrosa]|uniref:alpha/beta hydrolase-fold protein n=1 Tax=Pseudoalteromonas umbrosa TaxID=3048489 RepID=UPI0024C3553C|nr:alpha/beta hydrolase-fold protein [Pseudoalteromonas sp. B95]MDK1286807.1 alpha/beta hydrolase-fold protein [Pseudoalteromonas sp. B95]